MGVTVHHGDSREVLKGFADASIDSVVCDPPYALVSIGKRFGAENAAAAKPGKTGAYARASAGFMGQKWDTGETAFDPDFWAEVLRVLKPGGHLIAFGGTRTFHRLVVAVEDAGFDIRDTICWHFGSGFPKSHNPKKGAGAAVCRCSTGDDQLRGLRSGTDNGGGVGATGEEADVFTPMQRRSQGRGVGGSRSQGRGGSEGAPGHASREEPGVEGRDNAQAAEGKLQGRALCQGSRVGSTDGESGRLYHGASAGDGADVRPTAHQDGGGGPRGPRPVQQLADEPKTLSDEWGSQERGGWPVCDRCLQPVLSDGLGTALKPATELITLARKPLSGTVAANVLAHRTGALNIDGCRIAAPEGKTAGGRGGSFGAVGWQPSAGFDIADGKGRWPANVIHDGSVEVQAAFPPTAPSTIGKPRGAASGDGWGMTHTGAEYADTGSSARFFYSSKADAADRCGSKHPTVKPIDLMAYLCRLVTPPGGVVLDPFAGSGSTGMACLREGFDCVLIEREAQYVEDIHRRLKHVEGSDTPLFSTDAAPQLFGDAA